jgi:hypothetical protein
MPDKPKDFLERFGDKEFETEGGVDVATVPHPNDTLPDRLLRGQPQPPSGEPEDEGDDTFIFDESPEILEKYKQAMWRTDVKVGEKVFRYWGKTRTEVTKALIKAQQNASAELENRRQRIEELSRTAPSPAAPSTRTPDTKLPYDPVARKAPRKLSDTEILRLEELRQSDPVEYQRIIFEATTGYSVEAFAEVASRVDNAAARRIADEAAFQFQANHADDWEATPGNTAIMDAYLKERKWPVTLNNLEIAFADLVAQRRLVMPAPEQEPIPAPAPAVPPANAAPLVEEVPPPPPPVSPSGGSAPRPAGKTDADMLREEATQLRNLPLDQARERLANGFRQARSGR